MFKNILAVGLFIITLVIFSNSQVLDTVVLKIDREVRQQLVVVDVGGAVNYPGVYRMPEHSRVHQLVQVAGGFSKNVDLAYVNEKLNTAEILADSKKYFIPLVAKQNTVTTPLKDAIDINKASIAQLDTLTGIGKVTAEKIVSSRPYSDVQELVTKKVITQKVLDQIASQVRVE